MNVVVGTSLLANGPSLCPLTSLSLRFAVYIVDFWTRIKTCGADPVCFYIPLAVRVEIRSACYVTVALISGGSSPFSSPNPMLTTARYDMFVRTLPRLMVSRICWCSLILNSLLLLYIRLDLMVLIPFLRVPGKRANPLFFLIRFYIGCPSRHGLALSLFLVSYWARMKRRWCTVLSGVYAQKTVGLKPWSDYVVGQRVQVRQRLEEAGVCSSARLVSIEGMQAAYGNERLNRKPDPPQRGHLSLYPNGDIARPGAFNLPDSFVCADSFRD